MSLCYACRLEVRPGVTVPLEQCDAETLAHARSLEARREGLLVEVRHLIGEAYLYDLPIPDPVREALALWSGDVPELETLRDELAGCLM